MSTQKHKLLARKKSGYVQVRMLLRHPMETGNRRDKVTEVKIPRFFIRELTCEHRGVVVLSCHWGWGVSRNPYLSFRLLSGEAGEAITITWTDNLGKSNMITTTIK
ncbi:thiosulfate oxidation carrier complex protein SoxZ [Candidatus Thiodiazotropha endoloripes]|uniref:thiosulfate oxidation carrier complex protein SoxZ n=1 Tax=Candidatus Thiodiazotropha endoloripes TaxID=1818881 RepID=UPI0009042C57|nr:thiosulfate oxidation carrier complex protein SoxZ [Candidatus Thiodiazotropha endoloripes]MCW4193479.1 thiosulfate oxidation carrier complex protein SoxZ [Candidatus Thiodiazotropha weberae]